MSNNFFITSYTSQELYIKPVEDEDNTCFSFSFVFFICSPQVRYGKCWYEGTSFSKCFHDSFLRYSSPGSFDHVYQENNIGWDKYENDRLQGLPLYY